MPVVVSKNKIVWGIPSDPKPVVTHGLEGRCRIRFRQAEFATLHVLTPQGIRLFYLTDEGDRYYPSIEIGRNLTVTPTVSNP